MCCTKRRSGDGSGVLEFSRRSSIVYAFSGGIALNGRTFRGCTDSWGIKQSTTMTTSLDMIFSVEGNVRTPHFDSVYCTGED